MKRALIIRFASILLGALLLSSSIGYYIAANQMLQSNIDNLTNIANIVDYALEYDEDLQVQLDGFKERYKDKAIRITLIKPDGDVVADTEVYQLTMDNHSEREEVVEILHEEIGYSVRYSETLDEDMLYVACFSERSTMIIRVAIEHNGITEYFRLYLPVFLWGSGIALLVAIVICVRYVNGITKPLHRMVTLMEDIRKNSFQFEVAKYQYEELNIISNTTVALTTDIRNYMKKRELEKRIRQEFFSNASHELKTPITSIKGYAELLHSGMVVDEVSIKDCVGRIIKESDHMTTLINDILMISRLEANEVAIIPSKVRISPLLQEIIDRLRPHAMEEDITIYCDCEPLTIYNNHKQMEELFGNLISNAVKYNKPGGSVWIKIYKHGNQLHAQIRDDGMGISKQDKKRIFERFYCVDKGRSKKMGGTGLGLSIVKHIVEYNKGNIHLTSELGSGSTFDITLPFVQPPTDKA